MLQVQTMCFTQDRNKYTDKNYSIIFILTRISGQEFLVHRELQKFGPVILGYV